MTAAPFRAAEPSGLLEALVKAPRVCTYLRPYDFSPQGTTLAVQRRLGGRMACHLLPLSEPGPAVELSDAGDCRCPVFSCDGRYIFYARDRAGAERFDVCRRELKTGAVETVLLAQDEFLPYPDVAISPNGSRIACSAELDGENVVVVAPVEPRQGSSHSRVVMSAAVYEDSPSPVWSPDGQLLATTVATRGQDTAVAVVAVETGECWYIGGSDTFLAAYPAWAPDGSRLAFTGGYADHPGVGVYDVRRQTVLWAWHGDLDCHHPAWAPDGDSLAFLGDDGDSTRLLHLDLRSTSAKELIGDGHRCHYPSFVGDRSSIAVVVESYRRPPELYLVDAGEGSRRRLADAFPDELRRHAFTSGRAVRYTGGDHLADVPAVLLEPDCPSGAGAVVIHGGPTAHRGSDWDPLSQALAAAGVTVVQPNYRGSTGYGRRWQLANRWLVGQVDALDVMGAWGFLVGLGCDPRRIACTGRSHGGFLTLAVLTQFPALWSAAVAEVPFLELAETAADTATRADLQWWDRENVGDPAVDADRLALYSPINHVDRIAAPTLLLAAERDRQCPPGRVREVCARVLGRGVMCEAVVYEDDGHMLSSAEHRMDALRRTVAFILAHTAKLDG